MILRTGHARLAAPSSGAPLLQRPQVGHPYDFAEVRVIGRLADLAAELIRATGVDLCAG